MLLLPSSEFIGLINSFSFDCVSSPNRIGGLHAIFGEAVAGGPTMVLIIFQ
jgi:hypothetical protein